MDEGVISSCLNWSVGFYLYLHFCMKQLCNSLVFSRNCSILTVFDIIINREHIYPITKALQQLEQGH